MEWCVNHIVSLVRGESLYLLGNPYEEFIKVENVSYVITTDLPEQVDSDLVVTSADNTRVFEKSGVLGAHVVLIVLCLKECLGLQKLFESFWEHHMVNVILVDGFLEVYTYYPVSLGMCRSFGAVSLGKCRDFRMYRRESDFRQFNHCTLKVVTYVNMPYTNFGGNKNVKGVEDRLLAVLAEKLNFKANVSCPGCKTRYVLPDWLDLAIGGATLESMAYQRFDMLYYQLQNEIAIFTTLARPTEPWKNTLYIFDIATWTCLVTAIAALALTGHLAKLDHCLTYVVSVLFLNTCRRPARIKLLFSLWGTLSLILTSTYGGLLVSFMCKSTLEKQLATIEDMAMSGYSFGGTARDISVTRAGNNPKLNTTLKTCPTEGSECYSLLTRGNFGYICGTAKLAYWRSKEKGQSFYKKPTMLRVYAAFIAKKNSPFSGKVQRQLHRIAEHGVLNKLNEYRWKAGKNDGHSKFEVVTLRHLYYIFIAHFSGVLCASFAFASECFVKILCRPK